MSDFKLSCVPDQEDGPWRRRHSDSHVSPQNGTANGDAEDDNDEFCEPATICDGVGEAGTPSPNTPTHAADGDFCEPTADCDALNEAGTWYPPVTYRMRACVATHAGVTLCILARKQLFMLF